MKQAEFKEYVAFVLKSAREKKNISIKEMAQKLDVTPAVIYRYESGEANITIEVIHKYMDVLDLECDLILFRPRNSKLRKVK